MTFSLIFSAKNNIAATAWLWEYYAPLDFLFSGHVRFWQRKNDIWTNLDDIIETSLQWPLFRENIVQSSPFVPLRVAIGTDATVAKNCRHCLSSKLDKPARLTIRVLWSLFLIVKSEVKKQIGRRWLCHPGSAKHRIQWESQSPGLELGKLLD